MGTTPSAFEAQSISRSTHSGATRPRCKRPFIFRIGWPKRATPSHDRNQIEPGSDRNWLVVGNMLGAGQTHRLAELFPHLAWLPSLENKPLQVSPKRPMSPNSCQRLTLQEVLAFAVRQLDVPRLGRVANYTLGIFAICDRRDVVEQLSTQHLDAPVAQTQLLLGAVRNLSLPAPRNEILIENMSVDPSTGPLVDDRAMPGRYFTLDIRLLLMGHPGKEP